jgi:MFS family permease
MADIKPQRTSVENDSLQGSRRNRSSAQPSVPLWFSQTPAAQSPVKTDIPARLDRLPWSRFHLLVVIALGVTWILDGLEVTIVGAIGPVLQSPHTLALSAAEIGGAASAYVGGAVIGALLFGWLTDRHGRRLIFYVTLAVYLAGVLATATSWNVLSFAAFRAITGFGIGGEYAAINSAIDELIPARYRGRIDLIVNGSFWLGAAAGSGASLALLDPTLLPVDLGWRLSFAIGGFLGLGIFVYAPPRAGKPTLAHHPLLFARGRGDCRRYRGARAC